MREFGFTWTEVNELPWYVIAAARTILNVEGEHRKRQAAKHKS